VRFCGLPWDAARVRQAVAFSDFSELRCQEQTAGFRDRPARATGPFFRRGQVGAWREELGAEGVQRLTTAHSKMMQRFGYLPEDSGAADFPLTSAGPSAKAE
jgi:hypothetical protein